MELNNAPATVGSGALAAQQKEKSEVESALIVAMNRPRNEAAAFNRVEKAFSRPKMAELAQYSFPKGKTDIKGATVDLAREAARCWHHTRSGFRVVEHTEEVCKVRGFAWDLESNVSQEVEESFRPLIPRKNFDGETEWVTPNEKQFRELLNQHGATVERNAILKVLPKDLVDLALETAQETLKKAARGELQADPAEALRKILKAFEGLGVTLEMIEARLGHPFDSVDENELAELRQIYKLIQSGEGQAEDFFSSPSEVTDAE